VLARENPYRLLFQARAADAGVGHGDAPGK
jgi:hypothetical protein